MTTSQAKLIRVAVAALLPLTAIGVQAAKGGKPGKPDDPEDPPVPQEGHRYSVTVTEPAPEVFWGSDYRITGRIADSTDDKLLVNMNAVWGVNPYADMVNLLDDYVYDDTAGCTGGDWTVCFPGGVTSGTVVIPSNGQPGFEFSFTASNLRGKNLWYRMIVQALPLSSWDLYNLPEGESAGMALTVWTLAAGTGPAAKGCIGCGDFDGNITVIVTREADDHVP